MTAILARIVVRLADLNPLYDVGRQGMNDRECWECVSPTDCRVTEICYRDPVVNLDDLYDVNGQCVQNGPVKGIDDPLCYICEESDDCVGTRNCLIASL